MNKIITTNAKLLIGALRKISFQIADESVAEAEEKMQRIGRTQHNVKATTNDKANR